MKDKIIIIYNSNDEAFVYEGECPGEALIAFYEWWGGMVRNDIFKAAASAIGNIDDIIELLHICTSGVEIEQIYIGCHPIIKD